MTLTLRSGEVRRGKGGSQMRSMGSCWRVEEERDERGTTWRKKEKGKKGNERGRSG